MNWALTRPPAVASAGLLPTMLPEGRVRWTRPVFEGAPTWNARLGAVWGQTTALKRHRSAPDRGGVIGLPQSRVARPQRGVPPKRHAEW